MATQLRSPLARTAADGADAISGGLAEAVKKDGYQLEIRAIREEQQAKQEACGWRPATPGGPRTMARAAPTLPAASSAGATPMDVDIPSSSAFGGAPSPISQRFYRPSQASGLQLLSLGVTGLKPLARQPSPQPPWPVQRPHPPQLAQPPHRRLMPHLQPTPTWT